MNSIYVLTTRFIFLSISLSSGENKLFDAIKIKNKLIRETNMILNLEKYNISQSKFTIF